MLLVVAGCSQYIDPNVPEPIRPCVEPESGRPYLLYRPSSYHREHAWPLVVVCHSGFPDSPNRQIREWTTLAEQYGFLVLAPKLKGTTNRLSRPGGEQGQRQRADERCILSAVQHVRAGHTFSEDRILIYGPAGGAPTALYTGLRNAEVFRAISLAQPRFERTDMSDAAGDIDPFQPVQVNYRAADGLTGKKGRECADWLRASGGEVRTESVGGGKAPQRAVEFFQDVIRKQPWIHVRMTPAGPANPLEMRFQLVASTPPARFSWHFGDGEESPVAEPVHAYRQPGTYRVVVAVEWPKAGEHTRYLDVTVPAGTVRPAHGSSPQSP